MRARIETDPHDVNAMLVLAELMANTRNVEEAVKWYERAVNDRPDDPKIRIGFGQTLTRFGHHDDAELQLKKARELDPANPEPSFLLGDLYRQSSAPRVADARAMYEEVIRLASDSVYAQRARDALAELEKRS